MKNDIIVSGSGSLKKGIEVVMARGKSSLDITDYNTFNYLLQRSYNQLNKKSIHQIPVSDLLNFLSHTSIERVEKTLKKLSTITIEIDYKNVDTKEEHSVQAHFLSYDVSKAENGILTYAFDPILLKFLWEPKIYTTISLQFMQNFKNCYAHQLYQIMSFYQHRYQRVWTPEIYELRQRLGVGDDQYIRFDNLKRAVIDKAVNEVNQFAQFYIETSLIRGGKGGKVVAVKFEIVERPDEVKIPSLDNTKGSKKNKIRDPNTIDFVDGKTDSERGGDLVISKEALDDAKNMLEENNVPIETVVNFEEEWRQAVNGMKVTDPDLNFLRWIRIQMEKKQNDDISNLDDDIFGDILAEFE
jgi:plasmid replication initiation protein